MTRLSEALFIVVSNPVELAVKIFSLAGDRNRVIGMGAQQDSLRFARAIAADLGVSRHNVRATVLGEHGEAMIPLWRSVELMTDDSRAADHLDALRVRSAESPLRIRVAVLRTQVARLLSENRISEAYALAQRALPDARIFVEPNITVHGLHSTPNATANATLQVVAAALANDRRRIHGQVDLRDEVLEFEWSLRNTCVNREKWLERRIARLAATRRDYCSSAIYTIDRAICFRNLDRCSKTDFATGRRIVS